MTLFTLIWGACMLYGFTRKNMNAMVAMTLLFMTFQCANVISFGGFSVGPQILTSMCLIVRFLIFSKFRVYKTKYNNLVNVLLVVLVIPVISVFCCNICLICRCEWTLLRMMTTRESTPFLMLITNGRA